MFLIDIQTPGTAAFTTAGLRTGEALKTILEFITVGITPDCIRGD